MSNPGTHDIEDIKKGLQKLQKVSSSEKIETHLYINNLNVSTPAALLDKILAYSFGFLFLGIIAYAAFQEGPIAQQQFFFFRVICAISAAGIGAVIPGLLTIEISPAKNIVIRAAGALAIFAAVYFLNPPDLIPTATSEPVISKDNH